MDALFSRYANPFSILQQMIDNSRFNEFVIGFYRIKKDEVDNETLWEMYLHHTLLDKSFNEFKESLNLNQPSAPIKEKQDFETTVKKSFNILNGFVPE